MTLYQLQASWDDERAHARVVRYRSRTAPAGRHGAGTANISTGGPTPPQADGMEKQVRQDCRWLPVLIPLFALVLLGLAVIGG